MSPTQVGQYSDFRVPASLAEYDRWVLWRYEARHGKRAKVPYQIIGRPADTTNPATWTTFEEGLNTWRRNPHRYEGLGYVFTSADGMAGIDLDNSLNEQGDVKGWACGLVERFADTYTEISPSSKGLKIWARGSLPANLPGVTLGDGAVELYCHSRYFAVTGRAFRGAPFEVEDHASDLLSLYDKLTEGRYSWPLQPKADQVIPYGRQHNFLVSLCGTLRIRGVCEEAIESCLQIVNEKQCERPGSTRNISTIVRSSRKWKRQ